MKLIFIHGWGLDIGFWDQLEPMLGQYPQERVSLGFYGEPTYIDATGNILIGHSLGFVHGLKYSTQWKGWIAINSFPRFLAESDKPGCAPASELRSLRQGLMQDADKMISGFHQYIGVEFTPPSKPNVERLRDSLDELRDTDIGEELNSKPQLVLASRNDPLVPIATSGSMGNVKWHNTGGHILPQSDPQWCADLINRFLRDNFA